MWNVLPKSIINSSVSEINFAFGEVLVPVEMYLYGSLTEVTVNGLSILLNAKFILQFTALI